VVTTACMVFTNRLVYANILWIWGIILTTITLYHTINCHSMMSESIKNLEDSFNPRRSSEMNSRNHMLEERLLIIFKLRWGMACSTGVWLFCVGSTIYHFTTALLYDTSSVLHADPDNYEVSVIVTLTSFAITAIA
jgi:hypothetical protein